MISENQNPMIPALERPAIVYKVTNAMNGHFYIGVTGNLRKRKAFHLWTARSARGHAPLYRALRKYGRDAFVWEVVAEFECGADALAEEVRLIKSLNPHYNATPGGAGFNPTPMSPEGRARISAANRGKQRRLGMPHSEETKAILRHYGIRDKAKWLARSHLGPQAIARPVQCVTDGTVYPSASAAARALGVRPSVVTEVCRGTNHHRSVRGKVFRYYDGAPT